MLTWGKTPDVLDSHLVGPSKEGTLWHVFNYDQASRTFKDINSMIYLENEDNVGK